MAVHCLRFKAEDKFTMDGSAKHLHPPINFNVTKRDNQLCAS